MVFKLSLIAKLGLVAMMLSLLIGCNSEEGPNDPVKTSAEIDKMGKAMEKPSDGTGPAATVPGGAKR